MISNRYLSIVNFSDLNILHVLWPANILDLCQDIWAVDKSKEGGRCDGFVKSWPRISSTEKSQRSLFYGPLEKENAYCRPFLLPGLFYLSGSSGGHAVS